jgi:hypothetical protein
MIIKQVLAATQGLDTYYAPASALGGSNVQLSKLLNPLMVNALIVSGIVAFFIILIAGFNYISGAGDKNKMAQSTLMLTYAILGLVIVVSAFLITRIIGSVLGFKFF